MNLLHKVLLIGGIGVLVTGCSTFGIITSWYNDANVLQNATLAQWTSNQNTYDAFWKTVKETAQVPDKYKEDFKQLLVAETEARYGSEGSKASFQWIQERAVNFDATQYRKIQDVIESGRNDFKRSQNELVDKQRKVRDITTSFWGRVGAWFFEFPRELHGEAAPPRDIDGDGKKTVLDYPIVTSSRTQKAFQESKDEEINVFEKKEVK